MDGGKKIKVVNEVKEKQTNPEQKVSSDNSSMTISKVDPGNQSQVKEPANSQSLSQKAADTSNMSLINILPDLSVKKPRFGRSGRKRPLSQSIDESQMQLDNESVIQSFISQPSQQVSSEFDGDCRTCKEYKVEIKRLLQTNKRISREAEAAKQRMDKNMAITLKGQETLQTELTLLRRNSEKQHNELTALKALMREIQSAIGRYKF